MIRKAKWFLIILVVVFLGMHWMWTHARHGFIGRTEYGKQLRNELTVRLDNTYDLSFDVYEGGTSTLISNKGGTYELEFTLEDFYSTPMSPKEAVVRVEMKLANAGQERAEIANELKTLMEGKRPTDPASGTVDLGIPNRTRNVPRNKSGPQ